ncbi:hypothetical protein OBK28_12115 [Empedobacter falsenii]
MKQILYTKFSLTLFFVFSIFNTIQAQVSMGINTEDATRPVDVNGNMRVTGFTNKASDNSYKKVLAADANGNVDAIAREGGSIIVTPELQVEVARQIYLGTTADASKEVVIGKFKFTIRNGRAAVALSSAPTGNVTIQYGLKRLERRTNLTGGASYNTGNGDYYYTNETKTFTTSNFSDYQDVINRDFYKREFYRMHLIFPGEKDFYKVTFFRLQNSGNPPKRSDYNGQPPMIDGNSDGVIRYDDSADFNPNYQADNTSNTITPDIFALIVERYIGTPPTVLP